MPTDNILDSVATLGLGLAVLCLLLPARVGRIVPAAVLAMSLLAQYLVDERGIYWSSGWPALESASLILSLIMMIVGAAALFKRKTGEK